MTKETEVLIRATISADGKTVRVAPGIELSPSALEIVTDIPPVAGGDHVTIMFFHSEEERQEFAEIFREREGVDLREI